MGENINSLTQDSPVQENGALVLKDITNLRIFEANFGTKMRV